MQALQTQWTTSHNHSWSIYLTQSRSTPVLWSHHLQNHLNHFIMINSFQIELFKLFGEYSCSSHITENTEMFQSRAALIQTRILTFMLCFYVASHIVPCRSLNQLRKQRRVILKCLFVRHLTSSCCSAINSTRLWEYAQCAVAAPVYTDAWVRLKMYSYFSFPATDTTDDHTLLWLLNHIRLGIPELIIQIRHHKHTRVYAFFVTATYEK